MLLPNGCMLIKTDDGYNVIAPTTNRLIGFIESEEELQILLDTPIPEMQTNEEWLTDYSKPIAKTPEVSMRQMREDYLAHTKQP